MPGLKGTRLRLRDIPFIPFLAVLHVLFTTSSLLLRLVQSFQSPNTINVSPSPPPKHVAIVLNYGDSRRPERLVTDRTRRKALLESVRRLTQWAGEAGIEELSLWDRHGMVHKYRDEILRSSLRLPPSPPSSGAASPQRPSTPPTTLDGLSSLEPSSSYTIYPTASSSLELHLISPSSSDIISTLVQRYISSSVPPSEITQKLLDTEIKAALGFERDPDLLIVHPLSSPSLLRALLPRSPPELEGFPFWTLRITEIYQYPTPLPIPSILIRTFSPLLHQAQMSSLPLIRKAARLLPLTEVDGKNEYISGVISRQAWQGAMSAWTQVEQRLGK